MFFFFFSSRRRHTRCSRDWSSDVCSSDLAPLVLLAWRARRLQSGLPRGDAWLPPRLESVVALRDLEEMGRGAVPQTVRVILELPGGQDVLSRAGWQAARRLRSHLAQDPRVSATLSFATFQSDRPISRLAVFTLASDVRDRKSVV